MTIHQVMLRLWRAVQALARALSPRAPTEADALSWREDDSVFQTHAARARTQRAKIED